MLSLLVVLLVEVEDLLDLRALELIAQRRRLATPPLPVVRSPHRIRPSITISDTETDLVLSEHLLKRFAVNRARIEQCFHHFVAEDLLEPTLLEATATQIPIRFRLLWIREHLAALVPHQLIVHLPKTT